MLIKFRAGNALLSIGVIEGYGSLPFAFNCTDLAEGERWKKMTEESRRLRELTYQYRIPDKKAREMVDRLSPVEFNALLYEARKLGRNDFEIGLAMVRLFDEKYNSQLIVIASKNVTFLEMNFITRPFCKFGRRNDKSGLIYKGVNKDGFPYVWQVHPSAEFGDPRGFEHDIICGVYAIYTKRMLQNNLIFPKQIIFPTEELCEESGKTIQWDTLRRIEQALNCIKFADIVTKNGFRTKSGQELTYKSFPFKYFEVAEISRSSTGGREQTLNIIQLNDALLNNLRNGLKYRFWHEYTKSIPHPLAKRLFAFFTYGFVSSKGKNLHYNYSTLCREIPLEAKETFYKAKIQLKPALDVLVSDKFIRKPIWKKVKRMGQQEEWNMTLIAGNLFKSEYEEHKQDRIGTRKKVKQINNGRVDLREKLNRQQKGSNL